jgi:hypothetical protein
MRLYKLYVQLTNIVEICITEYLKCSYIYHCFEYLSDAIAIFRTINTVSYV